MRKLKEYHNFKFHSQCEKLQIFNISFTDDLILLSRAKEILVWLLMDEFRRFSVTTGLIAHPTKCNVYFGGVKDEVCSRILELIGFTKGGLSFKYLGVPLTCKKLTVQNCKQLIENITARIKHWTSNLLNYIG